MKRLLAIALVLAGCGSTTPSSPPTVPPTAAPTPVIAAAAPTAAPTPRPTPGPDPKVAHTLTIRAGDTYEAGHDRANRKFKALTLSVSKKWASAMLGYQRAYSKALLAIDYPPSVQRYVDKVLDKSTELSILFADAAQAKSIALYNIAGKRFDVVNDGFRTAAKRLQQELAKLS